MEMLAEDKSRVFYVTFFLSGDRSGQRFHFLELVCGSGVVDGSQILKWEEIAREHLEHNGEIRLISFSELEG